MSLLAVVATTTGWMSLIAVLIGGVLTIIGMRFWFVPEAAMMTFGLSAGAAASELCAVIAFRDIWLGGLAIVFALLKDWRALGLWLGLGTGVCFADAALVTSVGGPGLAIAFHVASGLLCAGLALRCWQLYKSAMVRP